ncbi:MAG: sugar kinase [Methylovulum sp.]|uniref:sugar kinase n=1 Tax=Methylovulum sp. TaxID=1916980 RepID=UPI002621C95C|nr:sugar kinase [Methylovulum sp.]MDD2723249.1 sugar kinase [Methylovulum sp.]MDD5123430.1 sugar kinase [Methylovulum sp.]
MTIEYAIIVKSKTRLELLVERFNTKAQAKFYIDRSGGSFDDYQLEHDNFHQSLSMMQRQLSTVIKNKIVERNFLPSFLFNDKQVVIVIGQDGLVANTAKYVNEIPIIAVNPDIARYDGFLLPFNPVNFIGAVEKVMDNNFNAKTVTLAEAALNNGQRLLAFNDLFIGASSHVSARYKISYTDKTEEHSSSGVIVSTQAGSTGWLSSIFNMTFAMHQFIEKDDAKKKVVKLKDGQLFFAVREPFQSQKTQSNLVAGILAGQTKLVLESYMPINGVIFSDGIESDFLHFNSGSVATIGVAKEKAKLVTAG